jgi:hypothetical protein
VELGFSTVVTPFQGVSNNSILGRMSISYRTSKGMLWNTDLYISLRGDLAIGMKQAESWSLSELINLLENILALS